MTTASLRVLIVEDHTALAENIADFLTGKHMMLDFASDGLVALHLLSLNTYDVLVVDLMLPGLSGYTLCRRVRNELRCSTPILLMTARDQLEDKARGFADGADDYLVKPFHLRELEMRIRALHRRGQVPDRVLLRGDVRYEPGTLKLRVGDHPPIQLSGMAAQLTHLLMRAHPDLVPHEELSHALWDGRVVESHTLRTHIYMLRKLLQEKTGHALIKTVHGHGYRFVLPGED